MPLEVGQQNLHILVFISYFVCFAIYTLNIISELPYTVLSTDGTEYDPANEGALSKASGGKIS